MIDDTEKKKKKKKKSWCTRNFCEFLNKKDETNYNNLQKFDSIRELENQKVRESLRDGGVDEDDIKNMVFDIFSSRKKFNYDFSQRLGLYLNFKLPIIDCIKQGFIHCLRCCRFVDYGRLMHNLKLYKKAGARLGKDCDIIEIMS